MQVARTVRLSPRRTIAFVGEGGASTRPLPAVGTVTIGSSPECELAIADGRLAPRHVKLQLSPAAVEIIDLGSAEGTLVGDRRIAPNQPTPLQLGISVTIGSTVFMLQAAHEPVRPRRLLTHGYFEARVDEECARAARAQTQFAIVGVRAADSARAERVAELLGTWTRSLDVIGVYAPGRFEVLLTQTSAERAEAIGKEIALGFQQQNIDVSVEVCCFPRDGRTTEVLVDRGPLRDRSGTFAKTVNGARPAAAAGFMARISPMLERVAAGEISVLVLGETGVGKEVMAHRIHALSPRAKKPFVALNCSAIAESLLESELFGHEKGAFTGAHQAKEGFLESADGGTVFLDEIGEMPLGVQAKLLRVIEQREITRVGSLKARPIDVRFVSATNRDLEREIADGRFRQDLYFRLNGITLSIPPLRERVDEIEGLAGNFVTEWARRAGKAPCRISVDALALMKSYPWPGNIRELRNMIERAMLLSEDGVITPEHLPTEKMLAVLPSNVPRAVSLPKGAPPVEAPPPSEPEANAGMTAADLAGAEATDSQRDLRLRPGSDEERRRIMAALDRCNGNQTAAAKMLGISRRTLVSRLSTFDLPRPRKR